MTVRIKICGITNREDALKAAELGADALGFIFYPPSPRAIVPDAAAQIIESLPPFICSVGVFVNESADYIYETAELCRLQAVQIHGDTPPYFLDDAGFCRIKALQVKDAESLLEMRRYAKGSSFVLDAFHPDAYGGTGLSFDWSLAKPYQDDYHIIIAGGLNYQNVAYVIENFRPYGVDIASGVEEKPGKKNPEKMRMFIESARAAKPRRD